jgi:carboxymethylenebutenolidase
MNVVLRKLDRQQDGVPGWIAHPAGVGRRPGVMMLHHAPGLTGDYKIWATLLAKRGFTVLVPDVYDMLGVPPGQRLGNGAEIQARHGDADFLAVFHEAWRAFAARPDTLPDRIGVVGHCMGGRLAIPFAADTAALRALVISYATIRDEDVTPMRPRHSYETARLVKCPTLSFYGGRDRLTPTTIQLRLWQRFIESGAPLEWHFWSEGRHGFANSDSEEFQPEYADAAWSLTVSFLLSALA